MKTNINGIFTKFTKEVVNLRLINWGFFFCIKHVIKWWIPCHGKFISKDFRTTQFDHESDQHFVWFTKFWGFFSGSELMAKLQRNWNYIILEPENLEICNFVASLHLSSKTSLEYLYLITGAGMLHYVTMLHQACL